MFADCEGCHNCLYNDENNYYECNRYNMPIDRIQGCEDVNKETDNEH